MALWWSKFLWLLFCREAQECQRLLLLSLNWGPSLVSSPNLFIVPTDWSQWFCKPHCKMWEKTWPCFTSEHMFVRLPCVVAYCVSPVYICTKLCHPASLLVTGAARMGRLATSFFSGDHIFLAERLWNSSTLSHGLLWEEMGYDVPKLQATRSPAVLCQLSDYTPFNCIDIAWKTKG